MAASQNGHVEVVDKLLQHGATVDLQHSVITTHTQKISDDGFAVLNLSVTLGSSFMNQTFILFRNTHALTPPSQETKWEQGCLGLGRGHGKYVFSSPPLTKNIRLVHKTNWGVAK